MSGKPPLTSKNSRSKTQLPSFVEMLDVSQKDIIKNLWNVDDLSISDRIHNIDQISNKMPLEARREYRKWRLEIPTTIPDSSPSNPHIKTITNEVNQNPNIRDVIAIDIGTSKCKIAICKEKYIQIVEHEANRSVPSYVALSEQGEWLVGRMAENYAVCLQNVIYDIRWLLGKKNGEINNNLKQIKKLYFFKRSKNLPVNATVKFDIIVPGKDKPSEVVDSKEIFTKLLEPLFTTAYKNLQDPTTIAITIPIKSEDNYKKLVKKCVESAKKDIVATMPSSTATQNQPEGQPEIKRSKNDHGKISKRQGSENQTKLQDKSDKRTPWDSIKIELIDEPIAVAAAYAPRLNIHPKGDVALVFCMGAGYLQVAAYFIQQKAQEEKANWTDLTISQISGVEPIVIEDFAGNDIDRLVFDNMMDKVTQQNGNKEPNLSERAKRRLKIACEKMKCALSFAPHTRIDVDSLYRSGDEDRDLVAVIQKDEIVKYYNKEVEKIIKDVWKAYKDLKPKFILLAGGSTRLPVITEYLTREFPESTICNFLNVDEVAAIGAVAIVSKTVTVAEKLINYKEVIGIIEGQEKEEKERRNPPSTSTPAARPGSGAGLAPAGKSTAGAPSALTTKSTPTVIPTPIVTSNPVTRPIQTAGPPLGARPTQAEISNTSAKSTPATNSTVAGKSNLASKPTPDARPAPDTASTQPVRPIQPAISIQTPRQTQAGNTPTRNKRHDGDNKSPKKGIEVSLVNNAVTESAQNINNSQIGGNNSFNNSHKILFYYLYSNNDKDEGRICLFNSSTCSVKEIGKFHNWYILYQVVTTQNKIFGISGENKSFEIYDLNTREISRGPDPPEWREFVSVAYFKDKLYYLGGYNPRTAIVTNYVDVLIDGKWQPGPDFPLPIRRAQTITCYETLYVIDGRESRKIYRLSDDEREWIEVGEIPEKRIYFGVASLNGKIYITGGSNGNSVFKCCLSFDPSALVDSRISRIENMNYTRTDHSLVIANGKLFAIGGKTVSNNKLVLCSEIEEYDPLTKKWSIVGEIEISMVLNDNRICLFNSLTFSVKEIEKFKNYYEPYQITTTQNKIFAIDNKIKSFEIYDFNTRRISRGPNPPEWRSAASVAYLKGKLYCLGGTDPKTMEYTNRVDVLINGKWQTGPAFPLPIRDIQTITCDEILYVIDGIDNRKIYRLSNDEREWIEVGEIEEKRNNFAVASLNGKIYITGGWKHYPNTFKSCLSFDPSAPVGSRISRITYMIYARYQHSLIAANEKLYAIGGFKNIEKRSDGSYRGINFCDAIEEYDPQTDKWREVGKINIK